MESEVSYQWMYDILRSNIEAKCANIGSGYASWFPSSMRNGNTAFSVTVPRTGADSNNSNTGTASIKWGNIPAVVATSTFESNLKTFFSNNGINCEDSSPLGLAKYAAHFINLAAIFVASQIKYTNDSGSVYYFYLPSSFPSVTVTAPSKGPVQEIDITNTKNQFASIISLQAGPISILNLSSLTASSSSSLFIAYFNLD